MKKTNYFFCYNNNLVTELLNEGFTYITKAKDIKSNKIFTLFSTTEELSEYLAARKSNKTIN